MSFIGLKNTDIKRWVKGAEYKTSTCFLWDFRNKKKKYLKAKIEELETNGMIKNIRDLYRGISDFKKGYQPRTNIMEDGKGDLVADSRSIFCLGGGTISPSY